MKYKVHIAYITADGKTIPAGIYDEKELDLAYARNRSIITAVDSTVKVIQEDTTINDIQTLVFTPDNSSLVSDVAAVTLLPEKQRVAVEKLKVNVVDADTLAALKHIGKATAQKVVDTRKQSPILHYDDLNKRVPLAKGKRWENVAALDFTASTQMDLSTHVKFV